MDVCPSVFMYNTVDVTQSVARVCQPYVRPSVCHKPVSIDRLSSSSNWKRELPLKRNRIGVKGNGIAHTRLTERRVPELIPVLGSQPAGDVSHKPGGRLTLFSARPVVTPATLYKRAATNFAAW